MALALAGFLCFSPRAAALPPGYHLVWGDEFGGTSIDSNKWSWGSLPWGGIYHNSSYASYITAEDSYLNGTGSLILRCRHVGSMIDTNWVPWTEGFVHSYGKFRYTYGYAEIRARFPVGKGTWPAFWTLAWPPGGWPPEFDIAEYFGNLDRLHTGLAYGGNPVSWDSKYSYGQDVGNWHIYGLEWGPGYAIWYRDGVVLKTINQSYVPTQSMYLLLNSGIEAPGTDPATPDPNYTEFDYCRVYVSGASTPPVISHLDDRTTNTNAPSPPMAFSIGDAETPVEQLTLTAASGNTTLVPTTNILISGTGSNRTVVVTPAPGQFGSALISLTLFDGEFTTTETFKLKVLPLTAALVATGSVWKYFDKTNDLGTAWRAPGYNDAGWSNGPAQLGFGDGDEATVLVSNSLRTTTYFRRAFYAATNAVFHDLTARILRDDGAVAYLNGVEVFRSNMSNNQAITWSSKAVTNVTGNDETINFHTYPVPAELLQPGTNVVAVEVHQYGTTSSDLSFDFALIAATNLNNLPAITWLSPASGSVLPPGAVTFSVATSDPENDLAWVEYFLDGGKLGEAASPPYSLARTNMPGGYHTLFARAVDGEGLTAQTSNVFVTVNWPQLSLVTNGSEWKYHDLGQNLGTNWRRPDFDDSLWASGPAPLGYGDANGLWPRTTNSFGPNANNKYLTTYYRRAFVVPDVPAWSNATVAIQRDDGAVVYLNGTEIFRSNLTNAALDHLTLAAGNVNGSAETNWYAANLNPALLRTGTNVLAVEIHQSTNTSSDIWFDLRLAAQPANAPPLLHLSLDPGLAQVSWPGWAGGLPLWSATNLSPPVIWIPETGTVTGANGRWQMTAPLAPGENRFYRLQTP